MVEWEMLFAKGSGATVHRIDVVDCLDSGVIVRKHDSGDQNKFERVRKTPPSVPTDCTVNPEQENTTMTVLDVLHGVPHEAILGYAAANAIDCIMMVCERTSFDRSLLGCTFRNVRDAATGPAVTVDRMDKPRETLCEIARTVIDLSRCANVDAISAVPR